jgi:hypothetical protein
LLDCLKARRSGPKSNFIGYDDQAQLASSRFAARRRQRSTRTSAPWTLTVASRPAWAWRYRSTTSRSQTTRSRTSLSAVTNLAQLSFAFDYADVRAVQ